MKTCCPRRPNRPMPRRCPAAGNAGVKPDRPGRRRGPQPGEEFLIQEVSISIGRAPELQICFAAHVGEPAPRRDARARRRALRSHRQGQRQWRAGEGSAAQARPARSRRLHRARRSEAQVRGRRSSLSPGAGSHAPRISEHETLDRAPSTDVGPGLRGHLGNRHVHGRSGGAVEISQEPRDRRGGGAHRGDRAVLAPPRSRARRGSHSDAGTEGGAVERPIDPTQAALAEAKKAAAAGNFDLAHNKLAVEIARSPALRDDPEVLDIEAGWADNVLARADKETDIAARRTLLSSVAQDSTVDAARRRNAADKLKEAEYLGTDIRELPPAGGSSQGADPPPRPSRPVLAADPWGGTGARGASTPVDTAKVSELALQGREGEARARCPTRASSLVGARHRRRDSDAACDLQAHGRSRVQRPRHGPARGSKIARRSAHSGCPALSTSAMEYAHEVPPLPHRAHSDVVRHRSRRKCREGRNSHPRSGQARARRSSACKSCFARSTSASAKMRNSSISPSRSRARPPSSSAHREGARASSSWLALRAPRGRAFTTTPRRSRRRRLAARALSQDAHPRRSALLREVLLHARRSRVPGVRPRRFGRIGTLVCWDQWYPEAARLTALRGADVLFYPTAIGWHPAEKAEYGAAQHEAWQTIQRSHAIANGVYVAAVNRVGHEGAEGRRHRILGRVVRRRSLRASSGRRLARSTKRS